MQIDIAKMVEGGKGLGFLSSGKAVLVKGALPGETVRITVENEGASYCNASVLEVIVPSSHRVKPQCPFYGRCGGCDLQHVATAYQAELKQQIVMDNLCRLGHVDPDHLDIQDWADGPGFGYRNRVRFHFDFADGTAGFLSEQSNDLVAVDHCPVLCDSLDRLLKEKKDLLKSAARDSMFKGQTGKGKFIEIPAFAGDDGISFGDRIVHVKVADHTYAVTSQVFFQSNRFLLASLLKYVAGMVPPGRTMDLYSGVGTFSAVLPAGTIAVEKQKACLKLAGINAPQATCFANTVEKWIASHRRTVDTIVVDPPRSGLDRSVPNLLSASEAKRIIYVSCNSVTLSRDVAMLADKGYRLCSIKVFDFNPQTHRTECVAVLNK
ncbi:MAG: class I SAM-dependent RNA methyltransferase [Spirochaetia bacterium]|jgi:23S rRNA (uracil1939-C5)-methyltransferase|nr:class I SAM-dependent RNA methyltransferase [Spirochaetia bacterium]